MSPGQKILCGVLGAQFVYGLVGFFATKNTEEMGGASFYMLVTLVLYGIYKGLTSG